MGGTEARAMLKSAGLRRTRGRVALLRALLGSRRPLAHDEACERVRRQGLDRVTVYRALEAFHEAGIVLTRNCKVVVAGMQDRPREVEISTLPYPGFPTDLQAPMMARTCVAQGASVFTDSIYPDRLHHVSEFKRMGARILKVNNTCVVIGVDRLQGAPVMASDLRGGAALVIAGLCAEGETQIRRVYHMDRGYENLEGKLKSLGARIRREPDEAPEHPPTL